MKFFLSSRVRIGVPRAICFCRFGTANRRGGVTHLSSGKEVSMSRGHSLWSILRQFPAGKIGPMLVLAAFALFVDSQPARSGPSQTYLALGDSLAFGQTTPPLQPSFGDQGYVKPYADWLATQNGGIRPNVINL